MSDIRRKSVIDTDEIVKYFVRDAEDLFDGNNHDSLRAFVRISAEFHSFLEVMEEDQYPSSKDSSTMDAIDLLRSGSDCFFDLYYMNRIIVDSMWSQLPVDMVVSFRDFRRAYFSSFAVLQANSTTLQKRFLCLLNLGKMQMVFIGLSL